MQSSSRDTRRSQAFAAAVALTAAPQLAPAGTVSGEVYADTDGDHVRSPADQPIAGAIVAFEDLIFVQTAADGTFTLDAPGAGQVWVRGVDGFSPAPTWAEVPSTGAAGVDLLLEPHPVQLPLRFVHASDPHVGVIAATDVEAPLRQATAGEPAPDFLIVTGDLTQAATPEQYQSLLGVLSTLAVPFVPGLGNHDWIDGGTSYRMYMGPPAYSFDTGGVHFIVLHGNATVAARLAFVQRDMAFTPAGTLTLAFIHYPITLPYDQQLFDGLVAAGVTHLFTGHAHTNRTTAFPGLTEHNVQPIAMGGIQLVPAGYEIVTIEGGQVRTSPRFVVNAPVLSILQPAANVCVPPAAFSLIVAAEPGGGQTSIAASVDGNIAPLAFGGGWDYVAAQPALAEGDHQLVITATTGHASRTVMRTFCVRAGPRVPASGTAWAQLQGDPEHHGAIEPTIDPPLVVAWTRSVGGFVKGSPVLADGRLFVPVAGFGTEASGGVVALDAVTGELLWEARVGGSVETALAVDDGVVIAAAVDGVVRAFDAATGALRWRQDLGGGLAPQDRQLYAAPTVSSGVVYAGQMYRFAAIDAATGQVLWEVAPSTATFVSPGQSTVAATPGRVVGVFGLGDEGVLGLDATTGHEAWRYRDGITFGMLAPPALDGDRAVLSTGNGVVISVDLQDGTERWRTTLTPGGFDYGLWLRASPAIAGGVIYIASQRDGLHAISSEDGSERWSFAPARTGPLRTVHYDAISGAFSSTPVVTGGLVWIGGDDGVLRALDAATGALAWSTELGAPILGGVVPSTSDAGGTLYVATWDGAVRALVSPHGTVRPPDESWPAQPPSELPEGCGCRGSSRPSSLFVVLVVGWLAGRRLFPRKHARPT